MAHHSCGPTTMTTTSRAKIKISSLHTRARAESVGSHRRELGGVLFKLLEHRRSESPQCSVCGRENHDSGGGILKGRKERSLLSVIQQTGERGGAIEDGGNGGGAVVAEGSRRICHWTFSHSGDSSHSGAFRHGWAVGLRGAVRHHRGISHDGSSRHRCGHGCIQERELRHVHLDGQGGDSESVGSLDSRAKSARPVRALAQPSPWRGSLDSQNREIGEHEVVLQGANETD
jgi:hypothetical protein